MEIYILKNNTPMPSPIVSSLVFLGHLADEAKSSYVKDMMLVHYNREVKSTFADEEYLREEVIEIIDRVNHRELIIKELKIIGACDSSIQSIVDLRRMQREDLDEVDRLMFVVTQKHVRLRALLSFIEKLEAMKM